MNRLIISYDLIRKNSQYYATIIKTIQSLGKAKKIHLSSWLLVTKNNAHQVSMVISKHMNQEDSLFVGTLHNDSVGLYGNNQKNYTIFEDLQETVKPLNDVHIPIRLPFHSDGF